MCFSDKAIFLRIVRRIIDSRRSSACTSIEFPFIDALLGVQLPEHPYQQSPLHPYHQSPLHPYHQSPQHPYHQSPLHPYHQSPPHPYHQSPPHPYNQSPPHPYHQSPLHPFKIYLPKCSKCSMLQPCCSTTP